MLHYEYVSVIFDHYERVESIAQDGVVDTDVIDVERGMTFVQALNTLGRQGYRLHSILDLSGDGDGMEKEVIFEHAYEPLPSIYAGKEDDA